MGWEAITKIMVIMATIIIIMVIIIIAKICTCRVKICLKKELEMKVLKVFVK